MRHILFLLALLLLAALPARAQLTLRLTSVPAATPAGATIYVAGTFNSWNPASAAYALTPQGGGAYAVTLPGSVRGAVEFKFTLGSWDTCEATASGGTAPNRSFTIPATGTATYTGTVPAWTFASTPASTASPSVSVLSTRFQIPQLGRTRTIRLYLPPDYAASAKRYPVLYMHDGQNLFDNATAFSGEWGVDETLDQLQAQGDYGCIVVGIDNGPQRLDEYSPYTNAQYGGGEGDAYVDFIANTLKPYIDSAYRTQPDRLHTGIMGSSMGGLISLYAALKKPEVFGRAGVFSPSLWFNRRIYTYAHQATPLRPDPRFYLLSGGAESTTQARDQRQMNDTLAAAGFAFGAELDTLIKADGQHAEWFWKREFPAAYRWLFSNTATATRTSLAAGAFELYPNPGTDAPLTVRFPTEEPHGRVEIYNVTGRLVATGKLRHGKAEVDVQGLPAGVYQVRVGKASKGWVKG